MTWNHLPTELHLAVARFLPPRDTRALSRTSRTSYSLLAPQIFSDVTISSRSALRSFAMHVPARYGAHIRRLSVCTKPGENPVAQEVDCTEDLATILATCSRLRSLSLSLAASLDSSKITPVFATLATVEKFEIGCWGQEETAPVSERVAVSLAASLSSLTHLTLSRVTRSALHVDNCSPPGVPLVLNDHDVPSHPILGGELCIPSLLKLPTLKSLELRDVWIDCDENMCVQGKVAQLERVSISGSMYRDGQVENKACLAWLRACGPALRSFKTGIPFGGFQPSTCLGKDWMAAEHESIISPLPTLTNFHVDAERVALDDLLPMLNVLSACEIKRMTIVNAAMCAAQDTFTRECASDEFEDWQDAIEQFLTSNQWDSLKSVELDFGEGAQRVWSL
ncbi:uncharacterized protein F5891DRAFT_1023387 [Suillus fuscotomentosus]|uniref:F-box domain-containing protein n=1 Tax=Suillus fuscotomentosus TaxID=1912939 RepID=A0AAD4E9U1_9AGAM|nr:uncharacterized protein F5891DRAFT_1023387 [Suillus fuscotomentosus]KAG1902304.1 hypothetical protein F5891DRAFT_1023387 [Suillus fuscotomentosus]